MYLTFVCITALCVTACSDSVEFTPSTSGFDMETTCSTESEQMACSSCCESDGWSYGSVMADTCGCTYSDETICEEASADGASCAACCEGLGSGYGGGSWIGGDDNNPATCSCNSAWL